MLTHVYWIHFIAWNCRFIWCVGCSFTLRAHPPTRSIDIRTYLLRADNQYYIWDMSSLGLAVELAGCLSLWELKGLSEVCRHFQLGTSRWVGRSVSWSLRSTICLPVSISINTYIPIRMQKKHYHLSPTHTHGPEEHQQHSISIDTQEKGRREGARNDVSNKLKSPGTISIQSPLHPHR